MDNQSENAASKAARSHYRSGHYDLTYWHKAALRMFREGANTVGIASALRTTEADAYNLLAQAEDTRQAA